MTTGHRQRPTIRCKIEHSVASKWAKLNSVPETIKIFEVCYLSHYWSYFICLVSNYNTLQCYVYSVSKCARFFKYTTANTLTGHIKTSITKPLLLLCLNKTFSKAKWSSDLYIAGKDKSMYGPFFKVIIKQKKYFFQ